MCHAIFPLRFELPLKIKHELINKEKNEGILYAHVHTIVISPQEITHSDFENKKIWFFKLQLELIEGESMATCDSLNTGMAIRLCNSIELKVFLKYAYSEYAIELI